MAKKERVAEGQMSLFDEDYIALINEENPEIQRPVERQVSFNEDNELIYFLKEHGTGFENGRFRIQQLYERNDLPVKERINQLRKEYGEGGGSYTFSNGMPGFYSADSKGLSFTCYETNDKFLFKWNRVDRAAESLVHTDSYLNAEEMRYFRSDDYTWDFIDQSGEDDEKQAADDDQRKPMDDLIRSGLYPDEDLDEEPDEEPEEVQQTAEPINYHIAENTENAFSFSPKQRFRDNVNAIKLLKTLESENRLANAEEQEVLAKYIGWGGLPNAFSNDNTEWQNEHQELQELLTEREYASARSSATTAFYTNSVITAAIYEELQKFGFSKGNLLEPGCGIGNFLGALPENLQDSVKMYGVEMDSLSGRIARQLYQKADIYIAKYQDAQLSEDLFDAAVGNVPFENFTVSDKKYGGRNLKIHDYFIAKTIDVLRPGGIAALITSSGTMDKKDESFRLWLSKKADLLGAVRLPVNAFSSAGTSVTADILILQKRETDNLQVPEWVHTQNAVNEFVVPHELTDQQKRIETEMNQPYLSYNEWLRLNDEMNRVLLQIDDIMWNTGEIRINSYYADNPAMIIGSIEVNRDQYGKNQLISRVDNPEAFRESLRTVLDRFEGTLPYPINDIANGDEEESAANAVLPAIPEVPNNAFTIINDQIYQRSGSVMNLVELSANDKDKMTMLIHLRDAMDEVLDANANHNDDEFLREKQKNLNSVYDKYTAKYGYLHDSKIKNNAKFPFSQDPACGRVLSLEVLDNKQKVVGKADIFNRRTIRYAQVITSTDNSIDALNASIAQYGSVDLDYMQNLMGKPKEDIINDLKGEIYEDPDDQEWKTADEYLSGNVRKKLNIAEQLVSEGHTEYQENVEALKKAQPETIPAADITASLGASWIPAHYINDFMRDVFGTPSWQLPDSYSHGNIRCSYSSYGGAGGAWNIAGKGLDDYNPRATGTYGTPYYHANAYWLLEDCLNLKQKIIKFHDPQTNTDHVDQKATAEAQAKQDYIKAAFKEWIFKDPERRDDLVHIYNDKFNNDRPREYDGSNIRFVGMNADVQLRQHQKNAIARVLRGGNTLLAHTVGAGKTYEMAAAAMELKRLGKCTKSMIVVPKHITEQWGKEFQYLYPGARLLVATENDFKPANRKEFCSRIATGNYDAVILGYTQFQKIPLSLERQKANLQDQIDELAVEMEAQSAESGKRSWGVKQMEKFKHQLEERLKGLDDAKRDENVIDFESLGIDHLFIDEAHNFKNLYVVTKLSRVAGISTSASQQAFDMYSKCRYMDEITGGKGITFATGTPISNSMTEMYTMMRYLQSDKLKEMGISLFDEWATTFGEITHEAELAPEGGYFRVRDRLAHFVNVPELMHVFKECADIKTSDDLNLEVPEAEYEQIEVEPSQTQKDYIGELGDRADLVHSHLVDVSKDNMLKITTDGRKAALDMRCIDPGCQVDDEHSKVSVCADNVYKIYQESNAQKGTQLVFCDQSTPGKGGEFSVYAALKEKLIEKGIPENEIAFIHDAGNKAKEKEKLFAKVRSGEIRVLIGSTAKMGTGTNAQERMTALHHLDVPWRPSDLEQREGRIIRQGNRNKKVKIFRYITKDTFDAYSWQLIEQKQRFASQIMTSKNPARVVDDVDESVLNYSEVKAACISDPEIKEQIDLKYEVTKLETAKKAFMNNIYDLQDKIRKTLPDKIKQLEVRLNHLTKDAEKANKVLSDDSDDFRIEINGKEYDKRKDAGEALMTTARKEAWKNKNEKVHIGCYAGFDLQAEYYEYNNSFSIILTGDSNHSFEMGKDAVGNMARLRSALKDITEDKDRTEKSLADTRRQLVSAKEDVQKTFSQEEELKQKSQRLAYLNAKFSQKGQAEMGSSDDLSENLTDHEKSEEIENTSIC